MNTTVNGSLAVEQMDMQELSQKLLDALRGGGLGLDLKGFITGFRGHVMSGKYPHLPSTRQKNIARRLCREIRYEDGSEPVCLIDAGDNPADDERELNWAEF